GFEQAEGGDCTNPSGRGLYPGVPDRRGAGGEVRPPASTGDPCVPEVRTAWREGDDRARADQPAWPPRLSGSGRRADRARWSRHEHPDDVTWRDDGPCRPQGGRRWRGALQCLVSQQRVVMWHVTYR